MDMKMDDDWTDGEWPSEIWTAIKDLYPPLDTRVLIKNKDREDYFIYFDDGRAFVHDKKHKKLSDDGGKYMRENGYTHWREE